MHSSQAPIPTRSESQCRRSSTAAASRWLAPPKAPIKTSSESPPWWRPTTGPHCDYDAHVITKKIATLTVRLTPTSLSSPIPTPNASRCHRAPLLLVYEGPLRWYRPCTTFQKISTAHQVPLDNETTHQVPSVVPLGRTLVSVSCTMSRALAKTRHAPELRFATLAKTRHDPIADTRALVSGTVINYLYLYFGVLLISFNTIHSILRMVYVR